MSAAVQIPTVRDSHDLDKPDERHEESEAAVERVVVENVEREEDDGVLSPDQQQLQHRVRHHHLQHRHPCNNNNSL